MNGKYKEELELIMNMYRSGKITGEQKDELVAALDKRSGKDRVRDCKKIVFRVITEKRTDPATVVGVLSTVAGVDGVTFDERNSLATVIGEFDVDGIINAARDAEIRLRVRDIDIGYEPEQKEPIDETPKQDEKEETEKTEQPADKIAAADENIAAEQPSVAAEKLFVDDEDEDEADEFDDELDDMEDEFDEDEDEADEFDDELDDMEDEFDELEDEFEDFDDDEEDDDDDDDDEDDDDEESEESDDVKIHIDDSRSLSEFLKGLGARISDAFDAGVKTLQSEEFGKKVSEAVDSGMRAAKGAGKKIADFADNMVIKTCDLGKRGVVIKTKAERYDVPYSQTEAAVKIVTSKDVVVFTGDAETVKAQSRKHLSDEMYSALCAMLDSEFTGKYKYVGNDTVLKLSVRPKI